MVWRFCRERFFNCLMAHNFKPLGRQLWRSTKKVAEGRKASCTNMAKSSELIRVLWFAKLCSFVALFSQLESLKQEYNLSKGQSPVPTQNSNDSSTGSPVVWKAQKVACWSSCPDHCTVFFFQITWYILYLLSLQHSFWIDFYIKNFKCRAKWSCRSKSATIVVIRIFFFS